jgi:uncharacterized protein YkwD
VGTLRFAHPTRWALISALGLSACTTGTLQPVTPLAVDSDRAASLVSDLRAANGLDPVHVDSRLTQAAAAQARSMGERDRIGHRVEGSLPRRLAAAGYDWGATAENLGAGYGDLDDVMAGWKASGEHRKNMLNPLVTELGVAAVATPPGAKKRTYWALILATPRPERIAAGPFTMEARP